jgi:hypothetical protein
MLTAIDGVRGIGMATIDQSMRMLTACPWRHLAAGMFHKTDAIVLRDYQSVLHCYSQAA